MTVNSTTSARPRPLHPDGAGQGHGAQAAPSSTATVPAADAPQQYTVVRGDTLTSIAKRHGTSVQGLLEKNPGLRSHPDLIRAGETLQLPAPERVAADPSTVSAARGRAAGTEAAIRSRIAGPDALRRGAAGEGVKTLQTQLNRSGSARPHLAIDGEFGARTEAALKRYQTSRGLAPSGVADEVTRTALAENRPVASTVLEAGSFGPEVRRLQDQLNRHGARIAVDGDFGPATERAVRAFQAANGISGDNGIVGRRTQDLLGGPDAKPIPAEAAAVSAMRATGYRAGRAYSVELASIGNGQYLTPAAAAAFRDMSAAAKQDGVHLDVVSSFRGNDEQRQLYNAYRSGRGNLAAVPGYSNHQQGLAVDITTGGSRQSASYRWLAQNGARFGFANTVASEPWHWEYIR